jgi:hydroxypyruvate isomerase
MAATQPRKYDVNCSILLTELPLLERPAAVRAAGFDAVEFWWPFGSAAPDSREVDAFVAAIRDAGTTLVGLNFFAGDMPAGDRGLVSWPGRGAEFQDSVQVAVAIGEQLGCRMFNALYGNRVSDTPAERQDEIALENLAYAADTVAPIGGTVLVEAVSAADRYPLRTAADAVAVLTRVNQQTQSANCRFLADLYHLAVNGDDLEQVIAGHSPVIGHVQIADVPGRGAPGTGQLDLSGRLAQLADAGYRGWVGLEYLAPGAGEESFGWLPPEQRRSRADADTGGAGQ